MLRVLLILLVAANLGFFAWARGWLAPWAEAPTHGERHPERLAQQVRPESIGLLSERAASAAVAAARATNAADGLAEQCLEAGPFGAAELGAAEALLAQANVAAEQWTRVERDRPAVWAAYVGPFESPEAQRSRADDLRRLNIAGEPVKTPAGFGLALGRYDSKPAAEAALPSWAERGVRGARAVSLAASAPGTVLRFERATPALRDALRAIKWNGPGVAPGLCR